MKGYLSMGAAILEGEYPAAFAAKDDDRFSGEPDAQCFSGPDLMRPGDRVPEIGMRIDASQVEICIHGYGLRACINCSHAMASVEMA
jgi:hypothetical protein